MQQQAMSHQTMTNQHKNIMHLPPTYKEFLDELKEACQKGDEDSRKMIESLQLLRWQQH